MDMIWGETNFLVDEWEEPGGVAEASPAPTDDVAADKSPLPPRGGGREGGPGGAASPRLLPVSLRGVGRSLSGESRSARTSWTTPSR